MAAREVALVKFADREWMIRWHKIYNAKLEQGGSNFIAVLEAVPLRVPGMVRPAVFAYTLGDLISVTTTDEQRRLVVSHSPLARLTGAEFRLNAGPRRLTYKLGTPFSDWTVSFHLSYFSVGTQH